MVWLRRLWPILFFAFVAVVPIWRAVFLGQAIGPFDQIRSMAPWHGPTPAQPWDILQADGVLQFFPWRDMVFDAWGKGQLPLWNPYELAGTPLLANSQSGGFYPPHIVLGLLHVPTVPAITLLAWFHLFWAGLGTFFLARRLGATHFGAAIGGASFALSPFMLGWTALASVISTVAWIPWILACIVALFKELFLERFRFAAPGSDHPGLTTVIPPERLPFDPREPGGRQAMPAFLLKLRMGVTSTSLALIASTGMMILAGHLQFIAYGFMAAAIMTIGFVCLPLTPDIGFRRDHVGLTRLGLRAKQGLLVATLMVLGIGLALPQLLPVLNYSQYSHRRNTPTDAGYSAYVASAIKPFELANLGTATVLGNPRTLGANLGEHPISTYWVPFVKQGANFAESAVTIGPLLLGLLILVPWKRRELWPIAAVGLVSLLLAFGTPLNRLLYFDVPGWSASGSPGRVIVLFVLSASVLGSLGADRLHLIRRPAQKAVALLTPICLCAIFAFIGQMLSPAARPDTAGAVSTLQSAANSNCLPLLAIGGVLAALGIAPFLFREAQKYRVVLVAMPIVIAWTGYASDLIPSGPPLPTSRNQGDQNRYAMINDKWELFTAQPALYPPNTASLTRLHELGGYDSLLHRNTVELLHEIDGQDPATPWNGNMMFIKPNFDARRLGLAGVSGVFSVDPIAGLGVPEQRDGLNFYTIAGPGRLSAVGGTAKIVEDGYDRQVFEVSPGTSSLIERDTNFPGWRLTGDDVGLPSMQWRSIELKPGSTRVELRYEPPGLRTGLWIGVVGWLALAVAFVGSVARLRRPVLPVDVAR